MQVNTLSKVSQVVVKHQQCGQHSMLKELLYFGKMQQTKITGLDQVYPVRRQMWTVQMRKTELNASFWSFNTTVDI